MNILEYVIDFPKSYGEDRLAIAEDLVCAIDGSSPIKQIAVLPFHSQAEWLASAVAGAVSLCSNGTIPEYAQMAVDSINFRYSEMLENFPDEMKPCAVLAGVQIIDDELHAYAIGDCSAVIEKIDGTIEIVTDNRIRRFSDVTKAMRNKAIACGEDPVKAVQEQMTKNRHVMNTPDGFWTVALKGYFEDEFVERIYDVDDVKRCLVFSDGFERVFLHELVSIEDILNRNVSLSSALKILRKWERKATHLDVKQHDDACAILIEL